MLITQDGTYLLTPEFSGENGAKMLLFISGTFGTSTNTLQYLNGQGDFIDLEDGLLLVNTQNQIYMGTKPIYLNVSGADQDTAIDVMVRTTD